MSTAARHPHHGLLNTLHQLRDSVPRQLVSAQTEFPAVALAERVESAVDWEVRQKEGRGTKKTMAVKMFSFFVFFPAQVAAHLSPVRSGSTHRTPS